MRLGLMVFILGLGMALSEAGHAADAAFFGLIKLQQFSQAPGGEPVAPPADGFSFQAFVVASTNQAVTNATVAFKPGASGQTRTLLPVMDGMGLQFEDRFDTQTALDAAYPAGGGFSVVTYTNTLYTRNDGVRPANLTFWLVPPLAAISAPSTPKISNLTEAQDVDTASDFTVRWNSLGTILTIVQLTVLDGASNLVFSTPIPFQDGALNGTSNSVAIPAHTLPVNSRLEAHLTAANPGLPNTNAYPGAIGVAALAKDLVFPLATRTVPPPLLSVSALDEGGMLVRFVGEPNYVHRIEASDDLMSWGTLLLTNPINGEVAFTNPIGPSAWRRFYRGRTER